MKTIKIISYFIGASLIITLALSAINILQNGFGYQGGAPSDILGKDPGLATPDDITKLSKSEFRQLFHALDAPAFPELKGEYRAMNLPVGIMAAMVDFYTDHFFGPGRWVGKAFFPFSGSGGWGYNLFEQTSSDGKPVINRSRKMNTTVGPSAYDAKNAFLIEYAAHNGGIVHTMRDELRRVNDRLYIGYGSLGTGGGSLNPSPFIVYGKPTAWVGMQ
ncbi:MAG: hypothetical protein MUC76_12290 [Spirochaetes bacterium]|jgi:hypothetical protein|nr:hypothetical protein [Spirochaetota bacterium]